MYSLDLKPADKVVYRRENSSVQAKVGHDELANIRSRPAGLVPALQRTFHKGKQEFRRTDVGSRLFAAEGEGGGGGQ